MSDPTTQLRARRLALGKTLADIARECGERCSEGAVHGWELLKREPRGASRSAYAAALEMSLEDLAAVYWRHSVSASTAHESPDLDEPSVAARAVTVSGDSSAAESEVPRVS